jgi:hypothetical protein
MKMKTNCKKPTVPCGVCGKSTTMTGTKRCDRCWELEGRIKRDPELARKILNTLVEPEKKIILSLQNGS